MLRQFIQPHIFTFFNIKNSIQQSAEIQTFRFRHFYKLFGCNITERLKSEPFHLVFRFVVLTVLQLTYFTSLDHSIYNFFIKQSSLVNKINKANELYDRMYRTALMSEYRTFLRPIVLLSAPHFAELVLSSMKSLIVYMLILSKLVDLQIQINKN